MGPLLVQTCSPECENVRSFATNTSAHKAVTRGYRQLPARNLSSLVLVEPESSRWRTPVRLLPKDCHLSPKPVACFEINWFENACLLCGFFSSSKYPFIFHLSSFQLKPVRNLSRLTCCYIITSFCMRVIIKACSDYGQSCFPMWCCRGLSLPGA